MTINDTCPGLFFFFNIYLFINTRESLLCVVFSSCGERRLLFVGVHGLLIVVASLVVEHGLLAHRLQ